MPFSVSAVMFSYNEGDHLEAVVRDTLEGLARTADDFELVVVDDGSTDGSAVILDRLARERPERLVVVTHPENRGIGEAVHTGYGRVQKEWVCILPADGQITAAGYAPLFREAVRSGADLVLGRYRDRGRADGLGRLVLSRGLRLWMWAALGVGRQIDSAYVFRREWLSRVSLTTRSFFVNLELPVRIIRGGGRVAEVPIVVHSRIGGRSKVLRLRQVAGVGADAWRLRAQLRRERRARDRAESGTCRR